MKVLIGCEFSGTVRDAFAARGHDAWSCDLLPSEKPGNHIQGDVLDVLHHGWDLAIFHPPCTYLCSSGLHHNTRDPERNAKTEQALEFVVKLHEAPIPLIAIENPIGRINTALRPPDQIIQPYHFGEDASKTTCLWLIGLPRLTPTGFYPPRLVQDGLRIKERWGNQTDSGQNKLGPSADRWAKRSVTYPGIAQAMAAQWG